MWEGTVGFGQVCGKDLSLRTRAVELVALVGAYSQIMFHNGLQPPRLATLKLFCTYLSETIYIYTLDFTYDL